MKCNRCKRKSAPTRDAWWGDTADPPQYCRCAHPIPVLDPQEPVVEPAYIPPRPQLR